MRIARTVANDNIPCYSRQIGVVITNQSGSKVLGIGYNGPAPNTPHCDDSEYLANFFWPQLTEAEKERLFRQCVDKQRSLVGRGFTQIDVQTIIDNAARNDENKKTFFVTMFAGCKVCPRRLVNAGSGERSELCSCGHAERHAITNAACDLDNAVMFCWCGIPCIQCSDAIIHSGITEVHCLEAPKYHPVSEWQLKKGGVELVEHKQIDF